MAIDLRSDTVTRPSAAMREAAAGADVGDDVYGEDPAVNDLEAAAAATLGFEDALYVPTGTMGNQIAAHVHGERGDEVVLDRESHIYRWELGGLAQLSGLQPRTVDAADAVPSPTQFESAYVAESLHRPGTGLLTLENTHNARGGVAVPAASISAVADAAHDRGVPVHLDGARLFNACVALDVDPERMTRDVDSVLFCLSKGLGAPVGSILVGDAGFIDAARRVRKLFGGGMRQAGLIAAPGRLALENVERLAKDHANAARLAAGLDDIDGLRVPEPDTNIVQVYTDDRGLDAEAFVAACERAGVRGGAHGDYLTRFCTHLDVDADDVDEAIERVGEAIEAN
ncbi:MAG: low specificity L-threonine aldolase [Halobellus sp.]|uniref:threonine aldolase family protein n=1 Tax=Halobellus sp. TaxID=1979212 RepID=UPI0035D430B3